MMTPTPIYPKVRNLDGAYFRVVRDGEPYNLSFTDLTKEEQNRLIENFDVIALKRMVLLMAEILRAVGDVFDIISSGRKEED